VPHITNQPPLAYPGAYAAYVETLPLAPMEEGRVLLTNKVTPGLVGWPADIYQVTRELQLSFTCWAYVISVRWTASDRDVRLVIII